MTRIPLRSGAVEAEPVAGGGRAGVPGPFQAFAMRLPSDETPPSRACGTPRGTWSPPFLPPAEWPRWRAMDWGYRRPFSIGWYALRPADSRIVRYRAYYGCSGSPNEGLRLDPQVVAAKMRLMETHERARGMRFFRNPADPSIRGGHGHETSVGMLFQRERFRWIKAATGRPRMNRSGLPETTLVESSGGKGRCTHDV